MIIYLYGSDSYRRREKMREITAKYQEKHSTIGVESFYLDNEGELNRLIEFVKAQSLFDEFKLAIIDAEGEFDTKILADLLKNYLGIKNIILLVVILKHPGKEFNFLLKEPVVAQEFAELQGVQLESFVKREMLKRGLNVSGDVIASLVALNNGDLWGIVNDLDKLALGGQLEESVAAKNFFVLLNRVKAGDLASLSWLLETEEAAKIFNILSSFAKTADDLRKMADYDVAIKSGKLEYEEALLELVTSKQ